MLKLWKDYVFPCEDMVALVMGNHSIYRICIIIIYVYNYKLLHIYICAWKTMEWLDFFHTYVYCTRNIMLNMPNKFMIECFFKHKFMPVSDFLTKVLSWRLFWSYFTHFYVPEIFFLNIFSDYHGLEKKINLKTSLQFEAFDWLFQISDLNVTNGKVAFWLVS